MIPPPTAVGGQQLAIATEHLKKKYEHKTQIQNTECKAPNTKYKTQTKPPDDSSSQRRQELAMGTACMEMQKTR